jgi:hypothetical protein
VEPAAHGSSGSSGRDQAGCSSVRQTVIHSKVTGSRRSSSSGSGSSWDEECDGVLLCHADRLACQTLQELPSDPKIADAWQGLFGQTPWIQRGLHAVSEKGVKLINCLLDYGFKFGQVMESSLIFIFLLFC